MTEKSFHITFAAVSLALSCGLVMRGTDVRSLVREPGLSKRVFFHGGAGVVQIAPTREWSR